MSLADIRDTYHIRLTDLKGGCNIIIISLTDYRFCNIIIADYCLSWIKRETRQLRESTHGERLYKNLSFEFIV